MDERKKEEQIRRSFREIERGRSKASTNGREERHADNYRQIRLPLDILGASFQTDLVKYNEAFPAITSRIPFEPEIAAVINQSF